MPQIIIENHPRGLTCLLFKGFFKHWTSGREEVQTSIYCFMPNFHFELHGAYTQILREPWPSKVICMLEQYILGIYECKQCIPLIYAVCTAPVGSVYPVYTAPSTWPPTHIAYFASTQIKDLLATYLTKYTFIESPAYERISSQYLQGIYQVYIKKKDL